MRAIIISISFLFLYLIIFTTCEKDANINIPDYEPKLVLYSIISPSDTVLYANIDATRNLYTKFESHPFVNLKIMLVDGDSTFQFTRYDTIGFKFKLHHKVYPGREYKIMASCDGFSDISAKSKIPAQKEIEILVDTVELEEGYSYMRIHLRDFSDDISYYSVSAYETEFYPQGVESISQECQLLYYEENLKYPFFISQLYLDDYTSGKLYTTEFSYGYYNLANLTGLDVTGIVMETDKNYYLYYSSLTKYKDPGNPFIEFSQVYSNVSGGYGIFASYVKYEKTFKLK